MMDGKASSELWDARELQATRDYLAKLPGDILWEMGAHLAETWKDTLPPPDSANTSFDLACHIVDALHAIAEGLAEDVNRCPHCDGFCKVINSEGLVESCVGCDDDGKPIPIDESERIYLARVTKGQRRWYHDPDWWRAE